MMGNRAGRRARGELETEVIAAVGAAPGPATVGEIQRLVDAGLSYTAVHTILARLVDKGLVDRVVFGRGQAYRPARDAAQVIARHMGALLERGPSRAAVLRSFLSTLSDDDEHNLRSWLDRQDGAPGPTTA